MSTILTIALTAATIFIIIGIYLYYIVFYYEIDPETSEDESASSD